ncbi:hypothetical protein [Sphaerisporangium rhizosphaerae]|uniref:Uncharacterized protein n=1 Tax=Sphaerisporangium rhizosphaerae TaxID=2269375 RepID=A0ABW2NTU5_9ACTN
MSYEGWEYGYVAGVAGALLYCVVNPVRGQMIGLAIGGVASKPSSLHGAGDKWAETGNGIQNMSNDLSKHVKDVPPEHWTAEDYSAVQGAARLMTTNFTDAKSAHDDAAKIMHGMGKLSFYGALASGTAGAVLTALTIYTLATRGIPGVNVATQASSEVAATGTQAVITRLVSKYGMAATAGMVAFSMVTSKQAQLEGQIAAMNAQKDGAKQVRIPLTNLSDVGTTGYTGTGYTGQNGANPNGTGLPPTTSI